MDIAVKLDVLERVLVLNILAEHFMGDKKGSLASVALVKKISEALKADEASDHTEGLQTKFNRDLMDFNKKANDYVMGRSGEKPERPSLLNKDLRGEGKEFSLTPKMYSSIQDALKEKTNYKPEDLHAAFSVGTKFGVIKDDPTL